MPSSTSAGVFGMTRTTGDALGQPRLDERGGDAGRQRDHQLARRERRRRSRRAASPMSCGFTTSDDGVGLSAPPRGCATTSTPYRSLELGGALRALLADEQRPTAAAGADQPGQQRLAHHTGAEDGDLSRP